MPKIIEDLRDSFLREARSMLQQDGGKSLTMRNVAARCHVAVGTVYNYFTSKDELMAHVMLEDWQCAMAEMQRRAEAATDVLAGLQGGFEALAAFAALYRAAWSNETLSGEAFFNISKRHELLIGQLTGVVAPLLHRFGAAWDEYLPVFLAETLLFASVRRDGDFPQLLPILHRLVADQ